MRAGAYQPRRRPPPRARSSSGPLVFVLLVIGLVVFLAGQGQAVVGDTVVGLVNDRDTLLRQSPIRALVASRVGSAVDDAADPGGVGREFEVRKGETAGSVSHRLEDGGLIRSRLAFLVVLYDTEKENDLQAGIHLLSPTMTPREIARELVRSAAEEQATLRIIEGWRLTEIADAVARAFPKITKEEFLKVAVVGTRQEPSLAGLDPATPLEGFLFPDTYRFKKDAAAETIVTALVATFEAKAGSVLRAASVEQKRPVIDLVKLASIVEREARERKESPTIAGVYANRLRIGMKLDADPTIQYAVGTWRPLTVDDLKLDSPYNTYRLPGLPPTPICSAGLAALEAAAKPEHHDFFYFVAKGDSSGGHLFAKTLDEQEANRVKVGNR